MKKIFLLSAGLALMGLACTNSNKTTTPAIKLADMDTTVSPAADFYQYANGGWLKSNVLPAEKSSYGMFDVLYDQNELKLKDLVLEIAAEEQKPGSIGEKIALFYKTGMDTLAIENAGYDPIKPDLQRIEEIKTVVDIQDQLSYLHVQNISSAYNFGGGADAKNSSMVIAYLEQGGLGLPDKDYYLNSDPYFENIRQKYTQHIANVFVLIGNDSIKAHALAVDVFNFEKRLATASMDRMQLRDPQQTYHKKTIDELVLLAPAIDWARYFEKMNVVNPGNFIVSQPDFIVEVNKMINDTPVDQWKTYFTWNLLSDASPYLSSAFVNERFDFYGKTLSGIQKQRPRWKKVLQATNGSLSEAIGEMYVAKYFPPKAKTRMLELVGNLKTALGERIQNLDWMSDSTKANGLEKLKMVTVKIGYPDKWKDYSTLEVKNDAYVLNMRRAAQFDFIDNVNKINKPVDKTEWHMPPQMVNAYYNPLQNEIVFPAAILQPPFFYLDADDAVNYGAIGVVIGHEMTHGFDDKGRQYDKDGNLNNWWAVADIDRFKERTNVLVKRYNQFIVLDTVHANGAYTLGENIADLSGLNISYTAFKKTEQWKNQSTKIDGFSPDQRFFLSYGKVWAELVRNEEILQATQTDVHSLGRFRVQGPLPNMPEFIAAFGAKPGDTYYLADSLRAKIW